MNYLMNILRSELVALKKENRAKMNFLLRSELSDRQDDNEALAFEPPVIVTGSGQVPGDVNAIVSNISSLIPNTLVVSNFKGLHPRRGSHPSTHHR